MCAEGVSPPRFLIYILDIYKTGDTMRCLTPVAVPGTTMYVPCGQCFNCAINYSNAWALRIMHEASLHRDNCVVTLTYAETDGHLHYRDVQLFLKRLRKAIQPTRIRFFCCGEYGGKKNRPHYHIIIFGWSPPDLVPHGRYYGSDMLVGLWRNGYIAVDKVTFDTAKYCAKYLTKLDPRPHEVRPFVHMSLKPGIGAGIVSPDILCLDRYYLSGKAYPIPKYYYRYLARQGFNIEVALDRRREIAQNINPDIRTTEEFEHDRQVQKVREKQLSTIV